MFLANTRSLVAALQKQSTPPGQTAHKAVTLYRRASAAGPFRRLCAWVTRHPSRLLHLRQIERSCQSSAAASGGTYLVPINQICGSEQSDSGYDAGFGPTDRHRGRWLAIAMACLEGHKLPPVELVQVGDRYFVQDGHCRVSVAKTMGAKLVEAHVTVWKVTAPLPWQQAATHQPLTRAWV